jgi:hypothetical protein
MAVLQISDILRVVVVCQAGSQYSQNVIHYIVIAQNGGFTDQEAATALSAQWGMAFKKLMAPFASFVGVKVQRLSPTLTQPVIGNANAGAGTIAGDMMSPQTCGLVSKKTDVGGRKGRGRLYIPFPSEADNAAQGIPGPTYLTSSNDVAVLLTTDVALSGTGTTASVHAILYNALDGVNSVKIIRQAVLNGGWGTQRRRSFVNKGDASPL